MKIFAVKRNIDNNYCSSKQNKYEKHKENHPSSGMCGYCDRY